MWRNSDIPPAVTSQCNISPGWMDWIVWRKSNRKPVLGCFGNIEARKIRKPENQHVSAINFPKTSSHLHREGHGRQAPERLNGDLFSPPVRTMMGLSWQPRTPSSFCQSWHKPTTRKKPCGSKHVLGIFNWS